MGGGPGVGGSDRGLTNLQAESPSIPHQRLHYDRSAELAALGYPRDHACHPPGSQWNFSQERQSDRFRLALIPGKDVRSPWGTEVRYGHNALIKPESEGNGALCAQSSVSL